MLQQGDTFRHRATGQIVQIHVIKDGQAFFCRANRGDGNDGYCCRCPIEQAEKEAAESDRIRWSDEANDWVIDEPQG